MLYEQHSTRTLEEIDQRLRDSAAEHRFGVVAVIDLQETMKKKGVDFDRRCTIYEVCNPHQAKRVLEANGAVSTALPCRISVYQSGDGFNIATILPTAMMRMFGDPALDPVAVEVEQVMVAMIRAAV